MINRLRLIGLLIAVLALAATPAVTQASRGHHRGAGHSHCVVKKAYVVKGTLVSFTADDPTTTGTNEAAVELKVTGANRHARRKGVSKDDDITYTAADDPGGFKVALSGFEPSETPDVGDKVRVKGTVEYTKKKCAPEKTLSERYGDVNVKRVKIIDSDGD